MSRFIKALLLSALVFPGIGQVYLGKKFTGAFFIVFTGFIICYIFFVTILFMHNVIQNDISAGQLDVNSVNIAEIMAYAVDAAPEYTALIWRKTQLAILAFIVLWVISIGEIVVNFRKIYQTNVHSKIQLQ